MNFISSFLPLRTSLQQNLLTVRTNIEPIGYPFPLLIVALMAFSLALSYVKFAFDIIIKSEKFI